MQKHYVTSDSNFFDHVFFVKDKNESIYMLYTDSSSINSVDKNILWLNIQRDIIFDIARNMFIILHLEKKLFEIITFEQLDKEIGNLYPVYQDINEDYFIEIIPNDKRLLTEIINTSLIWECGNLLSMIMFREKPKISNKSIDFEKAEVVIDSFYDNLGFKICICNMEQNEFMTCEKVKSVLKSYNITTGD